VFLKQQTIKMTAQTTLTHSNSKATYSGLDFFNFNLTK